MFAIAPEKLVGWTRAMRPNEAPFRSNVDLRAKVAEFHRLFYHRAPTTAQLDALLGEPGVSGK